MNDDNIKEQFAATNELLQLNTASAVANALGRFQDILQLHRRDPLRVRDIIPHLLLRLDREEECYSFLKWWATVNDNGQFHKLEDRENSTLPFLEIRGADPFEPIGTLCSGALSLSQLVALALRKLQLYLDISAYQNHKDGTVFVEPHPTCCRPVGRLDLPRGSKEEAHVVLHHCLRAWQETKDTILTIDSEKRRSTRVYQGTAASTDVGNARLEDLGKGKAGLKRKRGSGAIFPGKVDYMDVMPIETGLSARQTAWYISSKHPKRLVAYVDGACINNGRLGPRAGWAVVCGPPRNDRCVASGRLEDKGPFGDDIIATSNRAELRAAIATLRLCDWQDEGFESIVIATDSNYVTEGATTWAQGWVFRRWKTRTHDNVKNQDLWELLLDEVERWYDRGLRVDFLQISRSYNAHADTAAKEAARNGVAIAEFQDITFGSSPLTTAGTKQGPRVLALCLESESQFDAGFGSLIANIDSKARMERATTPETALAILGREPPPSIILIADGAITRQKRIRECVIDRLRKGAKVVLAGCFSNTVNMDELDRFFASVGLSWRGYCSFIATASLRPGVVVDRLSSQLPSTYRHSMLFIKKTGHYEALYTENGGYILAAVAFARVEMGRLGYIGNMFGNEDTDAVTWLCVDFSNNLLD